MESLFQSSFTDHEFVKRFLKSQRTVTKFPKQLPCAIIDNTQVRGLYYLVMSMYIFLCIEIITIHKLNHSTFNLHVLINSIIVTVVHKLIYWIWTNHPIFIPHYIVKCVGNLCTPWPLHEQPKWWICISRLCTIQLHMCLIALLLEVSILLVTLVHVLSLTCSGIIWQK